MSQIAKYSVILFTFVLFLEFIAIPTGLSAVVSYFGVDINPNTASILTTDTESSTFYSKVFGASGILIAAGIAGAVVVGFFTKSFDTSLVVAPLLVSLAGVLISTFSGMMVYVQDLNADWLTKIVVVIFGGFSVAFIWACIDYFRSGS